MKKFVLALTMALLTACAHSPVVSDFTEAPGDAAAGEVAPLPELLVGANSVILVMVHGVNDHCPGYALGKDGWINNPVARKHGFVPVEGSLQKPVDIFSSEFMPHRRMDPNSKVTYLKGEFMHSPTGKRVVAIEITWSQLTQWVKTQQLGYDITEPSNAAPDESNKCFYAISPEQDFPYSKSPPPRALINRIIKERTLDRSLADAVLYVGNYGVTIQRGIAEALCRALGGTEHLGADGKSDGQLCNWPTDATAVPEGTRFVFLTHSLGSRAIYDVLLGLSGDRVNPGIQTFTDGHEGEVARSRGVACRMIGHTAAVYMMANQLAMLGLAYHDTKSTSEDGPQPYDVTNALPIRGCGHRTTTTEQIAQGVGPEAAAKAPIVNVFSEIWERARAEEGLSGATLSIAAFNDTNDLLTWNVPRWYANQASGKTLPVHVTNVYVTNKTRWLGLFENPVSAHSGYFTNDAVWSVIECGASKGRVHSC